MAELWNKNLNKNLNNEQENCKNELVSDNSENHEVLTQLKWRGLKLIQRPRHFCLSEDTVHLAEFANIKSPAKVLELGSGNGAMLLLLWARFENCDFCGLEIMKSNCELARRNMELNNLEIPIICGDLKNISDSQTSEFIAPNSYDYVFANPPYEKLGSSRISPIPERAAARCEVHCTLEDVINSANYALKTGGCLYLVLPTKRMQEAKDLLKVKMFSVKRETIQNHVYLVEAVKM